MAVIGPPALRMIAPPSTLTSPALNDSTAFQPSRDLPSDGGPWTGGGSSARLDDGAITQYAVARAQTRMAARIGRGRRSAFMVIPRNVRSSGRGNHRS